MRKSVKRAFIVQQGFEAPVPALCELQDSALQFQPRIVLILPGRKGGFSIGNRLRDPGGNTLVERACAEPKSIRRALQASIARRPGAFRIGPAPPRVAQATCLRQLAHMLVEGRR